MLLAEMAFIHENFLLANQTAQRLYHEYAEAEPILLEGYQGMLANKDVMAVPDRYHLDRAHEWITQLYQAWGKPEKIAEWSNQ